MDNYTYISNTNPALIEDMYHRYKQDPTSIDATWRAFFDGFDFYLKTEASNPLGHTGSHAPVDSKKSKEIAVTRLINAYRTRGHLIAKTNPIRPRREHVANLALSEFGLSDHDLSESFEAGNDLGLSNPTLSQILDQLNKTYGASIGVEFMHCHHHPLRTHIMKQMEQNPPNYSQEKQRRILESINESVHFEQFLQTKFVGKKRFSLEGLEALIPALHAAIQTGVDDATIPVKECILGMAHRGRLNVLVNVFEKDAQAVFSEFEEYVDKDNKNDWTGDVKYHLGRSADIKTPKGNSVHLSLVPNPSHLETVNPVVTGIAYAKIYHQYNNESACVLPIMIHGDAAISGQGVNYELANMSQLEGYSVGGAVHIVLNNQVGFTANYKECRSSTYCTDLAKVTGSPVFHVNADDPEAVVHAMEMAVTIRQTFKIDVYVDILGYRRHGHNEGDEPRFTQPMLYDAISAHSNVYTIFRDHVLQSGGVSSKDCDDMVATTKKTLQEKLDAARKAQAYEKPDMLRGAWSDIKLSKEKDFETSVQTGVSTDIIKQVATALTTVPQGFNVFKKTQKLLTGRKTMHKNKMVDWGMAEQLAFGSLLLEGSHVRLSGQDCQRGTFSHRHAVLRDEKTEEIVTPLNQVSKDGSRLHVLNSHLSEYCVMGFEYGVSWVRPRDLVIWEAQFGDFSNGAQIMIDQYVSSSEKKWQRMSGLVLLLPHGYEGQGPEHSSARLERYLQLCAQNNMYVTNITTPANFFHALRRQVKNPFRIPLVVMSPKSLLRHPDVLSDIKELTQPTARFKEIIDDNIKNPVGVIACSGKIYYDLLKARGDSTVAIVRFEQLYPLPQKKVANLIKKYKNVPWVWAQEEPENMGAWSHIARHIRQVNWHYIGRKESASPAVGQLVVHNEQQDRLITAAFEKINELNQGGSK